MKKALSIAGSDSGGGAGIQQDLKVFTSLKVYGSSVVTAVTAQNTLGIQWIHPLPREIISAQIDSVLSDIRPDAVKTGLLCNSGVVELVYEKLADSGLNLVVDPVMISSSGDNLLDEGAVEALRKLVFIATLTTPNIHEAGVLSGMEIETRRDMEEAAREIGDCVVTGGHLGGEDVLCYGGRVHFFGGEKRAGVFHGTGCAFSAAVTAFLAKGLGVVEAVGKAKDFVDDALGRNFLVGSGLRVLDTGGLKRGRSFVGEEKNVVVGNIELAVDRFTSSRHSLRLMPEVGVNVVMALQDAGGIGDVAGLTGRLVREGDRVVSVGCVDFGGSSHVAGVVLTAMRFNPEKRAAMNVCFSDEILMVCEKLDLNISSFDRADQPEDTGTMEWGTSEAIKNLGYVPDIIYDRGAVGKEAMIRILGENATEVVDTALRIGELLTER